MADALISRIRNGVTVHLLLEGEPFGGLTLSSKKIAQRIHSAMKESGNSRHRIYVMRKGDSGARRYRYNHAKYVLADQSIALVSSENFSQSGHTTPGHVGNRGWDIVLHNRAFTRQLLGLFREDTRRGSEDIEAIRPTDPLIFSQDFVRQIPDAPIVDKNQDERNIPSLPIGTGDIAQAQLITSPQALEPLIDFVRSAQRNLEIQFMSLPSTWIKEHRPIISPLVAGLVDAARKGVNVRVLLNDESVVGPNPGSQRRRPNDVTAHYLETLAYCEDLPLSARVINVTEAGLTYIHNKGLLADGKRALVSSINGTRNSVEDNREVAVRIESTAAARYYGEAFEFDWRNSGSAPRQSRHSQTECQDTDLPSFLGLTL